MIADDNARCLACLALAALPFGDFVLHSNTAYSIWNWLFVLLALAAAPTSPSRVVTALQTLWSLLIIASHPLAILIVPFSGYALFRQPLRDKLHHGVLLAGLAIYMATSVQPQTMSGDWSDPIPNITLGVRLVFERVITSSVMGDTLRTALNKSYPLAPTLIGVGITAALLGLAIRRRDRLPGGARAGFVRIAMAAAVIGGLTIFSAISRNSILTRESLLFDQSPADHLHDPEAYRRALVFDRGVWSITYTGHNGQPQ